MATGRDMALSGSLSLSFVMAYSSPPSCLQSLLSSEYSNHLLLSLCHLATTHLHIAVAPAVRGSHTWQADLWVSSSCPSGLLGLKWIFWLLRVKIP